MGTAKIISNPTISKQDLDKVISIFRNTGIVTRAEVPNMDSRAWAKRLSVVLSEMGVKFIMTEAKLPHYIDYSNVLFDPERFSLDEAEAYAVRNVLQE